MVTERRDDRPRGNVRRTAKRAIRRVRATLGRVRATLGRSPIRIEYRRPRPAWPADRYSYQRRFAPFDINPGDRVLDVGSGADPFVFASILVERYLEDTPHRNAPVEVKDRPAVVADVSALPFRAGSFDYVYCAHVLEHVMEPLRACRELMRVASRGFIETPTMAKDILFAWQPNMHRWQVVGSGKTLCFFEYTDRQREGIRSSSWRDIVLDSPFAHPLQPAFYDNQDLFNVLFPWQTTFDVFVFSIDGSVASSIAAISP